MIEIGYALSSEEHNPKELVQEAVAAEESGFSFAMISDHFHPWTTSQGNSPFVWSVLGGIAQATSQLLVGTDVTAPIMRYHPAIIAQAAATIADMMPGRFFLGVGSGEYLNEHIFGDPWPQPPTRLEMLTEAIQIIRELWQGKQSSYEGNYYTVIDAQIFTLPEQLPSIYMAASGEKAAALAGQISDGLVSTHPDSEIVGEFKANGGNGKPCIGQISVCWAETEDEAKKVATRWWPVSLVSGLLHSDLPTPQHFDAVVKLAGDPKVSSDTALGPHLDSYIQSIQTMVDSGFDHVYIHQLGPDQQGFFRFFKDKLRPALAQEGFLERIALS